MAACSVLNSKASVGRPLPRPWGPTLCHTLRCRDVREAASAQCEGAGQGSNPLCPQFPRILRGFLIPTSLSQGTQPGTEAGWPALWEAGRAGGRQVPLTHVFLRSAERGGARRPAAGSLVLCELLRQPFPGPGAWNSPPGRGQIREVLQVAGSLGETQSG